MYFTHPENLFDCDQLGDVVQVSLDKLLVLEHDLLPEGNWELHTFELFSTWPYLLFSTWPSFFAF